MTQSFFPTSRNALVIGGAFALALSSCMLSGCGTLSASGPRGAAVRQAANNQMMDQKIQLVEVTDTVVKDLLARDRPGLFTDVFPAFDVGQTRLGSGDVIDVSIWEAQPAVMFGGGLPSSRGDSIGGSGGAAFGPLEVDTGGQVTVPFVGTIHAEGMTVTQLQQAIAARLAGRANQPQVVVKVSRNQNATVTMVGDFTSTARVPLTARGERLLDVIASVGGTRQPIGKTTIQITRGTHIAALPMDRIINDPSQNIYMRSDDVVTAKFQPYSFTALGAVGENKEISFEATGLTLAQALGRMGGLRDERANPGGVFVFRFEDVPVAAGHGATGSTASSEGKIPVIYRIDLKRGEGLFLAQNFKIHNGDLVYVANGAIVDLQKVLNMFSTVIFSAAGVNNLTR